MRKTTEELAREAGIPITVPPNASELETFRRLCVEDYVRGTAPDGWVMVPPNPTQEIVQAAQDYFVSHDEWGFSGMYRAMLAAAPQEAK